MWYFVVVALPSNYRSALESSVPEGRACGNCVFFDESRQRDGEAWCDRWDDWARGDMYCDAWREREDEDEDEMGDEEEESGPPGRFGGLARRLRESQA